MIVRIEAGAPQVRVALRIALCIRVKVSFTRTANCPRRGHRFGMLKDVKRQAHQAAVAAGNQQVVAVTDRMGRRAAKRNARAHARRGAG